MLECLEKGKILDVAATETVPIIETEEKVSEIATVEIIPVVETERTYLTDTVSEQNLHQISSEVPDEFNEFKSDAAETLLDSSEVPAEFSELKSDMSETLENIVPNRVENVSDIMHDIGNVSVELLPKEETISLEQSIVSLDMVSKEDISAPVEEEKDSPPAVPPRAVSHDAKPNTLNDLVQELEVVPNRPPRQSERLKLSQSTNEESVQEPEVDDEPPPRPPQPPMGYLPSQPPPSFYALRAQKYVDDNIPTAPRRRRHAKSKQLARSSSEESSEVSHIVRRHPRRSSDPSIAQLSVQLARACSSEANNQLKRLINYILNNVLHNEDGKQDLNVMIIIILVLIAGLLLLGYGDERTVVHLHHWEYFNPPKNL